MKLMPLNSCNQCKYFVKARKNHGSIAVDDPLYYICMDKQRLIIDPDDSQLKYKSSISIPVWCELEDEYKL